MNGPRRIAKRQWHSEVQKHNDGAGEQIHWDDERAMVCTILVQERSEWSEPDDLLGRVDAVLGVLLLRRRSSERSTRGVMARKILGHIAEQPPTFVVPRRMQVHWPAATSLRAPVY